MILYKETIAEYPMKPILVLTLISRTHAELFKTKASRGGAWKTITSPKVMDYAREGYVLGCKANTCQKS